MDDLNASELTATLTRRPAPVLTWFGAPSGSDDPNARRERIEISGPVARRWIAKTDNFLAAEFPFPADAFTTYFPSPHWREPLWIVTAWLRGLRYFPARDAERLDLAVSSDLNVLVEMRDEEGPDVLVAQTTDSLALAWAPDLPFGVMDGTADVMSYGDFVEMSHTAAPDTVLVHWEYQPGALRLRDLMSASRLPGDLTFAEGDRLVVTTQDATRFSAQLVQLWLRGAAVIWVPGGQGARQIAQAEGAVAVLGEGVA